MVLNFILCSIACNEDGCSVGRDEKRGAVVSSLSSSTSCSEAAVAIVDIVMV